MSDAKSISREERNKIKKKVRILQKAALRKGEGFKNVSKTCQSFRISRDTFYRWKKQYEERGEEGLREVSRAKPNLKNRVPQKVEEALLKIAIDHPDYGQERASAELAKKGLKISGGGVRGVWLRHNLQTPKLRLAAKANRK